MNPLDTLSRYRKTFARNLPFYLAGGLLVLCMKYSYSQADAGSLLWILAPTTWLVTFLTGIPYSYVHDAGYANHSLRILIAPTCSGVRFLTILFTALFFSFVHRVGTQGRLVYTTCKKGRTSNTPWHMGARAGWMGVCLLLSYLCTILTNSLRIVASLYLPPLLEQAGLLQGMLTPHRLHTLIGILTYLPSLLALYHMTEKFFRKAEGIRRNTGTDLHLPPSCKKAALAQLARACVPPLCWYLLLTLGIPLLGRAYAQNPGAFAEYTLLILLGCFLILVPCCMIALLSGHFLRGRQP